MGMSTIGSFIMMFFVILILISTLFMIFGTLIDNTSAVAEEQARNQDKLLTSVDIVNVTFDNSTSPDTITILAVNDGKRKMFTENIDIYIDGIRIPRNNANRTISFYGTNIINPLHWDPNEMIEVNILMDRIIGEHTSVISVDFGMSDQMGFTYS